MSSSPQPSPVRQCRLLTAQKVLGGRRLWRWSSPGLRRQVYRSKARQTSLSREVRASRCVRRAHMRELHRRLRRLQVPTRSPILYRHFPSKRPLSPSHLRPRKRPRNISSLLLSRRQTLHRISGDQIFLHGRMTPNPRSISQIKPAPLPLHPVRQETNCHRISRPHFIPGRQPAL